MRKTQKTIEQNKNARIAQYPDQDHCRRLEVLTKNRDLGTLLVKADVRLRDDVESGRSLTGLSLKTAGGRNVRLTGPEARTLLRILDRAING